MRVDMRGLRRLIEFVISEGDNPGSSFLSAVKGSDKNRKKRAVEELQKTYDWFVEVVFPAIENDEWPIVADDDYNTLVWPIFDEDPANKKAGLIPKGTRFDSLESAPVKGRGWDVDYQYRMTLFDFYKSLENTVISEKLPVTMESDQPDDFES